MSGCRYRDSSRTLSRAADRPHIRSGENALRAGTMFLPSAGNREGRTGGGVTKSPTRENACSTLASCSGLQPLAVVALLHILAPVADIPRTIGAHTAARVVTAVYGHVHEGQPKVPIRAFERNSQLTHARSSWQCIHARHRIGHGNVIHHDTVAGPKRRAVLR